MADRPLRILVLANLPPHAMGGAENQAARLVEAWSRAGAKVEVAGHCIPNGEQLLGSRMVRTTHIRTWRSFGRFGRGLGYALSIFNLIRRRRLDFDVVYCRGLGDGALSIAVSRTLGLCDWKVLAVPINAGGAGDAAFLRSIPLAGLWLRLLDRKVDVLNLINSQLDGELDSLGLISPTRTHIPNGIALGPTTNRTTPATPRRLVWTGRMEHQKGLDVLLPALAKQKARGAAFQLTLWGNGTQREALVDQASALGLSREVVFAGSYSADRIREALQDADAFVLPSRYEGMSNSALEAMEAGLPVLCTRCGGIDSYIGESAGWTCLPGDVDALDAVLSRMLDASCEEWLRKGRHARALVEKHFDINVVAAENLRIMSALKG